jgi:hypothetical protein
VRLHPVITIVNESTIIDDAAVERAIIALQHQITYHFEPHWNAGASLLFEPTPNPKTWNLFVLDDSDQAGALGYHDFDPGRPVGRVFAKTDLKYGLSWTVTASHELLEMLADPDVSRCYQTANQRFHALEVGDPVEADEDGYEIDGVLVSDFILPTWFGQGETGRLDYRGLLAKPLELRPGGYASIWQGGGWHSVDARGIERKPDADDSPRYRDRGEASWSS